MGISSSLILWGALSAGVDCPVFFRALALETIPAERRKKEIYGLTELSRAACKTSSPDLVWKIAHTESGFRFLIISFNERGMAKGRLEGEEAVLYIRSLINNGEFTAKKAPNIDMGVLQINLRAHFDSFASSMGRPLSEGEAISLFSPRRQVAHIVEKMSEGLVKGCGRLWVGCYHSRTAEKRDAYLKKIAASGRLLEKLTSKLSRQKRGGEPPSITRRP